MKHLKRQRLQVKDIEYLDSEYVINRLLVVFHLIFAGSSSQKVVSSTG